MLRLSIDLFLVCIQNLHVYPKKWAIREIGQTRLVSWFWKKASLHMYRRGRCECESKWRGWSKVGVEKW